MARSGIERVCLLLLRKLLARWTVGRLTIVTPSGATLVRTSDDARPHPAAASHATLTIHRWRMLPRLLRHGDIGFAESYLAGDWSSPDVAALIALAAHNRDALDATMAGSLARRIGDRIGHWRRANTRAGSRRNIVAHYDLGNAFYERWLDAGMVYSSALYRHATDTLEEAQACKLDAIVAQLDLRGGERVLEIGCGWGALALRLAEAGCDVVAITLSPAQQALAAQRVADAGRQAQVDIRLQDYRDIEGSFDRIVSIEMFEAVGEAYWTTYFTQLAARLAPGGRALLQVITIAESRFAAYRRDVDFIQRYVFPGGMLPPPSRLRSLACEAGLGVESEQHFGASYARTLAEWHRRFLKEWPVLTAQGFDDRFKRLWEYYLKYCEGGFAAGAIDVGFYRFRAPGASGGNGQAAPTA
nr:cyclopropane-fatty-acyl-phospholipid synthase family protein [Robbsia betulipollinis]